MTENKLNNLLRAVKRLNEARLAYKNDINNSFIRDSLIQRFEFSIELAWKTLREFMIDSKYLNVGLNSPKKVISKAYEESIIKDSGIWLRMLDDRNLMAHIYEESDSIKIAEKIMNVYCKELNDFIKSIT